MTLALEAVTKVVGSETHIRDVTLTLAHGSLNVLLGPTLSGKTSLMRLMAGLDKPTSGRVLFDDTEVTGINVGRRNVAMVYQQFINYPTLTVYENIASPLRVAGRPREEIKRRVGETAELLKLGALLRRTPLQLSGGQQQRVAIARALVKDARLVLLDEPLANLDYKLREELREELPRIFAASGAIFVYATTEPTEALLLGGNTATLHEGRITQFGPTLDVYRRPSDRVTAEVFSDPPMNFISGRVIAGKTHLPGDIVLQGIGPLSGLSDRDVTLGFRPNHLFLRRPNAEAVAISANVLVVEITGSESFVHVAHEGMRWVSLAHGVHRLSVGAPIEVFLDPHRVFVFGEDNGLIAAPAFAEAA